MAGDAAFVIGGPAKQLRNDRLDRFREHSPDLRLFVGGKRVNDTVNGFGRIIGMKGGENQHSHGGASKSQANGFQITHFTDQNDVRVGTHRAAQRAGKRIGMNADFAMDNGAFFVFMDEFDRVFNGDDVF